MCGERTESDRMLKSPRVAMETSRSVFLTCKGRDLMRSEWEKEEAAWVGARSSVAAGWVSKETCGLEDALNISLGTPTPARLENPPWEEATGKSGTPALLPDLITLWGEINCVLSQGGN